MDKTNVKVDPQACWQCHCCQLICSLRYTGAFNPEKARIILNPPSEISFTDECVANCSLCTRYCTYGALVAQ